MKYNTYEVSIVCGEGLKFFEVVACDHESAVCDVRAAYGDDVEVCAVWLK